MKSLKAYKPYSDGIGQMKKSRNIANTLVIPEYFLIMYIEDNEKQLERRVVPMC